MMELFYSILDLLRIRDRYEREERANDRARTRAKRDELLREFERSAEDEPRPLPPNPAPTQPPGGWN